LPATLVLTNSSSSRQPLLDVIRFTEVLRVPLSNIAKRERAERLAVVEKVTLEHIEFQRKSQ
jgi:hypothetical protein